MLYLNYYSKIRNTIGGDIHTAIERERGKIVTKQITESKWSQAQKLNIGNKASRLSTIITNWVNSDPKTLEEHYTEFRIPKSSGGYRTLHAPDEELKKYQNMVKDFLEKDCKILCHNAVHSYVKHRNCKTAMQIHQRKQSLMHSPLCIV